MYLHMTGNNNNNKYNSNLLYCILFTFKSDDPKTIWDFVSTYLNINYMDTHDYSYIRYI